MTIEEHVPLAHYTTFKIGGNARFFCRAHSIEDIKNAFKYAHEHSLRVFILGGGSNILVSDDGFDGMVIKIELKGIKEMSGGDDKNNSAVFLTAAAGEEWDVCVEYATSRGYWGLENLSKIPGTVGAAPVQNIGAYGVEVGESVVEVKALVTETLEEKVFSHKECRFSYRDSIFKRNSGKYVIVSVTFKLSREPHPKIDYKDIKNFFIEKPYKEGTITPRIIREAIAAIREAKLPNLSQYGTAGSFFKNPIISRTQYGKLILQYPDLPFFPTEHKDVLKVPLAWILDHVCNAKEASKGGASVYPKQALVLVNNGSATEAEVMSLAHELSKKVLEKTGITTEFEVLHIH